MRNWSIPAGRIFGVQIRIHLTFLLLLLFIFVDSVSRSLVRSTALVGIIFFCVVAHELGHAFAAGRQAGARVIILLPLGGVTLFDESAQREQNPSRQALSAIAGPMVNIALAIVGALMMTAVLPGFRLSQQPFVTTADLARSFVWVNVFLGGFNLLPAYPLDGGRVLRALFSLQNDPITATRRAVTVGQLFALGFIIGGLLSSMPWLMLIGFFLFVGGQLEDRSATFQAVLETVRMEDVMLTDFRTLSPADTLEDALHTAVHSLQDDFPVVRGSDMVGVISKQKIIEALRSNGNGYIQPVMSRMFEIAKRGDSLASAFRKITGKGITMIPVVDDGRLVGIVTLQNLMHSISLVAEARRAKRQQES